MISLTSTHFLILTTLPFIALIPLTEARITISRASSSSGCTSDNRLFNFEDRRDCVLPDTEHEEIPPAECPPAATNRNGLVFLNIYSFDKSIQSNNNKPSNYALVAPAPNRGNGPFTFAIDPQEQFVTSFNIQSLNVNCFYYKNARWFMYHKQWVPCVYTLNCRTIVVTGGARFLRNVVATTHATTTIAKRVDPHDTIWTLDNYFNNSTSCELTAVSTKKGVNSDTIVVVVDNLALVVNTCGEGVS